MTNNSFNLNFIGVWSVVAICSVSIEARVLTAHDIREIYREFVEPNSSQEYKNRYVPLPMQHNNTPWNWHGKDFPRIFALLEFKKFVESHALASEKALALNGAGDPEWHYLPVKQKVCVDYEESSDTYDLQALDLPDKDFDFVMVNQTFEHIYDPVLCLENIYKHMRPGGILYLNVPSNSILHSTPFHHYVGYTPVGIGAVVKAAGFRILSIGHWGNLEYLRKLHETLAWPDFTQISDHANDAGRPVITWIFAIKDE